MSTTLTFADVVGFAGSTVTPQMVNGFGSALASSGAYAAFHISGSFVCRFDAAYKLHGGEIEARRHAP